MARKTVLVDDVTGEEGAETVRFGWQGVDFEVDLVPEGVKRLEELLEPFVSAGRRVQRPVHRLSAGERAENARRRAPAVAGNEAARSREETAAIRAWARENGWPQMGDRGRLPSDVLDAYDRAQGEAGGSSEAVGG